MRAEHVGSWRELSRHVRTATVLAGGVLVGAINIYLTASLLPNAVEDIGGEQLYAWNATVYLCGQVAGTMVVGQMLSRCGAVAAYLAGFGTFAVGSIVCAVSPAMPMLLTGRAVQGLAAGLLTGLGFALIHSSLPRHLWVRGSALVSAMYGVGNVVGPAVGGLFAQFGSWRLAFVVLAFVALMVAALVPRALPRRRVGDDEPTAVPVVSLGLVIAAVAALSVAGVLTSVAAIAVCIGSALILIVAFLAYERRTTTPILPTATFRAGSTLRWVYLTIFFLTAGVAVETFLPLFGQRLAGLAPLTAGFLAAVLSLGWSISQMASSSVRGAQAVLRLQVAGPAILAAAFAVLVPLQMSAASPVVLAWPVILFIGGAGIGLAMPHLSVAAMSRVDDTAEGTLAGTAIATILTMATAFGSALAGLLLNAGAPDLAASARLLMLGFSAVAGLGILTAICACRPVGNNGRR
ncbi:MFS family permease [Mycobacterium frederiksbergense]|uniref:MFS family permease n=1 Tax=Mycolicibacterium frederiksbergense TaxID=117567 RepID=A0ABT6L5X1_9MYCO|nr:MFS transporter [Mycolicibacterium frederiksbergense]MDH6198330.1 MFS family permease [Mycolicibacterium frederiksbergense]